MEKRSKKCKEWLKKNKTKVLIVGAGIGAAITAVVVIKNQTIIEEKLNNLKLLLKNKPDSVIHVEELPLPTENMEVILEKTHRAPHLVRMHLRDLPMGQNPSSEKVALAKLLDIHMAEGQTWVEQYRTGEKVA